MADIPVSGEELPQVTPRYEDMGERWHAQARAIALIDDDGMPYGVRHVDNKPCTSSVPFLYDVAQGNIFGHLVMTKFGYNPAVGSSEETISDQGGLLTYLRAAETLRIASNDARDDAAGSGARVVQVHGLDGDWNEQKEVVSLSGGASVATVNPYLRVFRAIVRSAGTSGQNVANIDIKNNLEDTTLLRISAGNNQTLAAFWSVPAGYTAFMVLFYHSVGIPKETQTKLYIRPFGEVFQLKRHLTVQDGYVPHHMPIPKRIEAKSDIEVRGIASGGGGAISAGFDLWYKFNG